MRVVAYEEEFVYRRPQGSPIPAAIITSVLTTVAVYFGLRFAEQQGLLPGGRKQQDSAEVPSLLGMKPEQAREILRGRDLLLNLAGEKDDAQYPAGSIAAQMPLPGSQVARGSAVQTTVSQGAKQLQVPNLIGLPIAEALKQLATAGIPVGAQTSVAHATAAVGVVTQTTPVGGAPVAVKETVALVVSAGPAQKSVPKVTGLSLKKAREAIQAEGLVVGKIRYISDGDEPSGVMEQKPATGTAVAAGTAVDLLVND